MTLDSPEDPQVVQINIKSSKMDPFRKGISVFLGRTNSVLCPVAAMVAYLASRKGDPGPFKFRDGLPRVAPLGLLLPMTTSSSINLTKEKG